MSGDLTIYGHWTHVKGLATAPRRLPLRVYVNTVDFPKLLADLGPEVMRDTERDNHAFLGTVEIWASAHIAPGGALLDYGDDAARGAT